MNVLSEVDRELIALDGELASEEVSPELAERIRERIARLRRKLQNPEAEWVGTTEAKRLIGVKTEHTIKAWARLGLLRSRKLPNGRVQVHLADVRKRAAEQGELDVAWSTPLSQGELDDLVEARPGTTPWQRDAVSANTTAA